MWGGFYNDISGQIATFGEPTFYERKATISSRRRLLTNIYMITHGCAAVYANLPCGRLFYPQIYLPDDFMPATALAPGDVRFDMVALTDVEAIAIPRAKYLEFVAAEPKSHPWLVDQLKKSVVSCAVRGTVTNFGDAGAKLGAFLAEIWIRTKGRQVPEDGDLIPLNFTQTDIGLINGLSKAQVSRTIADLQNSGDIAKTEAGIVIVRAGYLQSALHELMSRLP